MRKALFAILMAATTAVPAVVQAQDNDLSEARREARADQARERYRAQGERNQARAERRQEAQTQRAERRQVRQERVEAPAQQRQQAQPTQQSWSRRGGGGDSQRGQRWGGGDRSGSRDSYRQHIEATREASRRSADQTIGGNYARQAQRNQERYEQRVREQRRDGSWDRDGRRDGSWDRDGRRDGSWQRDGRRDNRWSGRGDSRRGNWNRNWRTDNRYDWQRYRYSNRSLFRSGGYYAPYRGYRYNRLSIGLFLDSLFYSNRYWLSDPYQYRLPPAPYGTQWVRYYDDVVLVDIYTGEVLDVIHDFFW